MCCIKMYLMPDVSIMYVWPSFSGLMLQYLGKFVKFAASYINDYFRYFPHDA